MNLVHVCLERISSAVEADKGLKIGMLFPSSDATQKVVRCAVGSLHCMWKSLLAPEEGYRCLHTCTSQKERFLVSKEQSRHVQSIAIAQVISREYATRAIFRNHSVEWDRCRMSSLTAMAVSIPNPNTYALVRISFYLSLRQSLLAPTLTSVGIFHKLN